MLNKDGFSIKDFQLIFSKGNFEILLFWSENKKNRYTEREYLLIANGHQYQEMRKKDKEEGDYPAT